MAKRKVRMAQTFRWSNMPMSFTADDARRVEWKSKRGTASGEELLALFWFNNP